MLNKNLIAMAVLSVSMVACGGGGGGSATNVIDDKPFPLIKCGEWSQNGDGTESRMCSKTIDGEVVDKYTETRESAGTWTCNQIGLGQLFYNSREVDFEASGIAGYTCSADGEVSDLAFFEGYSVDTLVFIDNDTIDTGTAVTIVNTPTARYFDPTHIDNGYETVPVYIGHDGNDDHVDNVISAGHVQSPIVKFMIAETHRDDTQRGRLSKDGSETTILERNTNAALAVSIDDNIPGMTVYGNAEASYYLATEFWSLPGSLPSYTSFGREVAVSALWASEILATRNQFNVYSVQNANEIGVKDLAEVATNHGGSTSPLSDAVMHVGHSLDRTLWAGAISHDGNTAMAGVEHDGLFIQHMVFVYATSGHGLSDSTSNSVGILAGKIAQFASDNPHIEIEDLKDAFIDMATEVRTMEFYNGKGTYTIDVRVAI